MNVQQHTETTDPIENAFAGRVRGVHGQIVRVEHDGKNTPPLLNLLESPGNADVKLEVYAHQDQYHLYCISLGPIDIIHRDMVVTDSGKTITIPTGKEVLGRVIDLFGNPLDGGEDISSPEARPIYQNNLNYHSVTDHKELLETGIKHIDFFTPFVKGGKMGMIGGAGVGKTILLTEILRNVLEKHDGVAVFAGIGERIREGHELYNALDTSGVLNKTAMVFAQMNTNAAVRYRSAWTATSLAEFFRDKEEKDVLFFVDNVYRFVQAGSELSTLMEQIPSELGYQATLDSEIASFQRRLASTKNAAITSVQNIYVPADELSDPGVKAIMSHLDSSVVLSRSKATLGQYPPIDTTLSSSTHLSPELLGEEHFKTVSDAIELLNEYERLARIVSIIGEQELTANNQTIFKRGRLLINYMTQPFFVTENQTGKKGVYVKREETVKDVKLILEGKTDNVPIEKLLFISTLRDAKIVT